MRHFANGLATAKAAVPGIRADSVPLSWVSIMWDEEVVAGGITAATAVHDAQGAQSCQHNVLGRLQGAAQKRSEANSWFVEAAVLGESAL